MKLRQLIDNLENLSNNHENDNFDVEIFEKWGNDQYIFKGNIENIIIDGLDTPDKSNPYIRIEI